jgi:hypothetical protein
MAAGPGKMSYTIVIDLAVPTVSARLDAMQRAGLKTLLWRAISITAAQLHGTATPVVVEVSPAGAVVVVEVESPTLERAEAAARRVVEFTLESVAELSGWQVLSSEVRFDRFSFEGDITTDGESGQTNNPLGET